MGAEDGVLPLGVATTSSLPPIIIVAMVTGAADVFCVPLVSVVWSLLEAPPKTAPSPPNLNKHDCVQEFNITFLDLVYTPLPYSIHCIYSIERKLKK